MQRKENEASVRPMRIMLVTEPSGGGSGRHVADLASYLTKYGHQVCVVYSPLRVEPRFEAELKDRGIWHVTSIPMRRAVGPWDVASAIELRRLIVRLGPFDIIHAHSSKAGALARLAAPRNALKVYTPHAFRTMDPGISRGGRLIYGNIERVLGLRFTDALVAVAPEEANHAFDLGIPPHKVHMVVNGVSPGPKIDRQNARQMLGLEPTDIAVGFVGRLAPQKDPVRFAEAIKIANASDPRIRGIVLGAGELEQQTFEAGKGAVRLFSGMNARDFMPAFDIFALTSRYEAMPYVLLEALSAGLPIVATNVGGTSLTVKPSGNGIILNSAASSNEFASALVSVANVEKLQTMSQMSTLMSQDFDIERMAIATEKIYRNLTELYREGA